MEQCQFYFQRLLLNEINGFNRKTYAYFIKLNKLIIGVVGIVFFEDENGSHWDLGYFMHPKHQGKGYTKEAAKIMCQLFFEQYDCLEATVSQDNEASIRILKALGAEEIAIVERYNSIRKFFVIKK